MDGTNDDAMTIEWDLLILEFYTFIFLVIAMVLLLVAFAEFIYYITRFKPKESWKSLSLITTYGLLTLAEFLNLAFVDPGTKYCVASAIITHYLRLSVSINLSLVGFSVVILIYSVRFNKKSFIAMFFMLSYGIPFIIVLVCSLVFFEDYNYDQSRFQCLVYGDSEYYGLRLPVLVILSLNFIYLIAVVARIILQNYRRRILRRETISSNRPNLRRRYSVKKMEIQFYIRLFCVTGPIWQIGVLTSFFKSTAAYWIRLLTSTTQGAFLAIVVLFEICRNFGAIMETTNTVLYYDDDDAN